jgi:Flp pilus assembly protein TadG
MSKGPTRRPDERGATLVEFAFILPIFVLFVFGVIDLGWAFAQNLDVKQGAREGGRIVAVNGGTGAGTAQCQSIQTEIRNRTQELNAASLTVLLTFADSNGDGAKDIGDLANVTVKYPVSSLSGLSTGFLSGTMQSRVSVRLEQPGTWTATDAGGTCQ